MMCERTAFEICPACDGDRGWESAPWGVDYRDGSVLTSWIACDACDRRGEVEVPVELIDEYDLDEMTPPIEAYEATLSLPAAA